MAISNNKILISVAGPTAAGKTELAMKLAQYFKTEIISADSRQFYREMEIGTAKPSKKELDLVPHHFINSHAITDSFSVADFEKAALKKVNQLFETHQIVIIVGGSGLFLQAIYQGFDEIPEADPAERERWNKLFKENGIAYLQEQLQIIDPEYYKQVDLNNPQRIIRALEVSTSVNQPFSSFLLKDKKVRPFQIIKIGINPERDILYNRINNRVDEMAEKGLVKEVENLLPYQHLNTLNTVGYKEIFESFNKNTPIKQALENVKQNTRRFAKRQLTWFKKDQEVKWFPAPDLEPVLKYILPLIN